MKASILILSALLSSSLYASDKKPTIEDSITKLKWNGMDVVFIEDNRFPTYDLSIYFADGSLSEKEGENGITTYGFNLLDSGTKKLKQEEILEKLEYLATQYSADVTHEYTRVGVSGLVKDMNESMSLVCSLMRDTIYPEDILKKEFDIAKTNIQNSVSNHRALAERVFREVSMSETPYSYPVGGKLKDFPAYTPKALRAQMDYFLNNVKKRIYITGPKDVLKVESILVNKCNFKATENDVTRSIANPVARDNKVKFLFVPVADANQVQLRIGRFLNADETSQTVLNDIASEFLGGGFTSRLMREVRTKRGLTYSIGSFVSSQKQYGRSGISTFTKNETIDELIKVIDDTVNSVKSGIKPDDLTHATQGMIGAYPFRFENNNAFLSQLLFLDHVGRPYSELFDYKDEVAKYSSKEVADKIIQIFELQKQTILVLGDKSIEPKLKALTKKYGELKVLDYNDYL